MDLKLLELSTLNHKDLHKYLLTEDIKYPISTKRSRR